MSAEDEREGSPSGPGEWRDPALERVWRVASREQPPSSVDARILAAARAASGAERTHESRSPRWWARWQPMLAAAAVAGLAFVLVPLTSSPPPAGRATEQVAPATAPSSGIPVEDAPLQAPATGGDAAGSQPLLRDPAARAKPAGTVGTASGRGSAITSESIVPRAPDSAPADASAAPSSPRSYGDTGSFGELGATAPPPSVERGTNAARTRENAAAAPTAQRRENDVDQAAVVTDAAAWVRRIASAYRRGDLTTAASELRAFRAVEPAADDRLPEDLRGWARTVE